MEQDPLLLKDQADGMDVVAADRMEALKKKDGPVDRPFSNGGQLMCHEDASPDANLMKTVLVLLGYLMPQHKFL
jgi:hypothetical protein